MSMSPEEQAMMMQMQQQGVEDPDLMTPEGQQPAMDPAMMGQDPSMMEQPQQDPMSMMMQDPAMVEQLMAGMGVQDSPIQQVPPQAPQVPLSEQVQNAVLEYMMKVLAGDPSTGYKDMMMDAVTKSLQGLATTYKTLREADNQEQAIPADLQFQMEQEKMAAELEMKQAELQIEQQKAEFDLMMKEREADLKLQMMQEEGQLKLAQMEQDAMLKQQQTEQQLMMQDEQHAMGLAQQDEAHQQNLEQKKQENKLNKTHTSKKDQ